MGACKFVEKLNNNEDILILIDYGGMTVIQDQDANKISISSLYSICVGCNFSLTLYRNHLKESFQLRKIIWSILDGWCLL